MEKILPLLNVRLIAVNDNYDSLTLTNSEQLVSNIKNLVNDLYAKDISRKSSTALRVKQRQGAFIGTYASYGYLKDPSNKNKIIVDHETAGVVRQIFEWKADGMGNARICRRLAEMGIPSPNKYRFMKGIVKSERYLKSEWAAPVIKRILTCQIYVGNMEQGRKRGALYEGGGHEMIDKSKWTVVPSTHEPIISKELFDRANAVINERTAAYKKNEGKYAYIIKTYSMLKGLVYCADCGKPLFRRKKVRSEYSDAYWTYQCLSHSALLNCPNKYIHENELYSVVYEAIRIEIQKCSDIKNINKILSSENSDKSKLAKFDAEIAALERELRCIASLRRSLYNNYAMKLITITEYQLASKEYAANAKNERKRLESARREKMEYAHNCLPINNCQTELIEFMDTRGLTAELAQTVLERVEVSGGNNITVIFKFCNSYEAYQNGSVY